MSLMSRSGRPTRPTLQRKPCSPRPVTPLLRGQLHFQRQLQRRELELLDRVCGNQTTPSGNSFGLGNDVLSVAQAAAINTHAWGQFAVNKLTTGINNLANGQNALANETTGGPNLASGNDAMRWQVDGVHNVAVGLQSSVATTPASSPAPG